MAKIKSLEKISKKWNDRVQVSDSEYEDGIKNPVRDWEDGALASQDNYEVGIRTSIEQGRRPKGIKEAGTKKWQVKSVEKKGRWRTGVTGAQDEMKKGFSPYHDVIEGLDYGPKYPAGDPRNLDRVKVGNDALHKKKVELKSL